MHTHFKRDSQIPTGKYLQFFNPWVHWISVCGKRLHDSSSVPMDWSLVTCPSCLKKKPSDIPQTICKNEAEVVRHLLEENLRLYGVLLDVIQSFKGKKPGKV